MIIKLKYPDPSTPSGFGFRDVSIARAEWEPIRLGRECEVLSKRFGVEVVAWRIEEHGEEQEQ